MKNNYNPYTVPENFFETSCGQTLSRCRSRIRAFRCAAAVVAVAAIVLLFPLFSRQSNYELQQEQTADSLADMYEYDIFLQVNFME